jgi:hypothetical protein
LGLLFGRVQLIVEEVLDVFLELAEVVGDQGYGGVEFI